MATTKPAAKPATKPATKPAAKTVAKPAAKAAAPAKAAPAAKPAAAPAKKPAAKAVAKALPTEPAVGVFIEFAGYGADVPADDQVIEVGTRAKIVEVDTETNPDAPGYIVRIPNPDFNPEVAEDAQTNPSEIEASVYDGEFTISDDQTDEENAAPVESAPATQVKAGRAKTKGETAPVVAEEQPAHDELPELTQEDADVLAMVEGADQVDGGLIGIAQDLEADIESKNFQLGGVLYHIKRDKAYETLGEEFTGPKGFDAFVAAYFKFGYRKAMNLIDIYVTFNQLNIADAASVVAEIGWTKASKLTNAMTDENAEELIELARTNTVEGLTDAIRTQTVAVGDDTREKKTRVMIKLRYFEDEGKDIEALLHEVKDAQGLKTIEEAFAYIVAEFRMAQGNEAPVAQAPVQQAATPARAAGRAATKAPAAAAQAAKPAVRRAAAQAA